MPKPAVSCWPTATNKMLVVFFLALDECPYLKHEFATHLYNELRKENPNEQI